MCLSCMKVKFKGNQLIENIELDGGLFMKTGLELYVRSQMGFTTGVCGIRSQMM